MSSKTVRFAVVLAFAWGTATASSPDAMYWVERIESDGTIVVQRYTSEDVSRTRNPVLDFPKGFGGIDNPFPTIRFIDQDWSEEVLRMGYAKLRNPATASPALRAAEEVAKTYRLGVWESLPPSKPLSVTPIKAVRPPRKNDIWKIDWVGVLEFVKLWGGVGTALGSIVALIAYLVRLSRRTRVYLLFLGPQAVGKTWLWCRLVNPEITKAELLKMGVSNVRDRYRQRTREPFGKHELRPVYVTVPGGQPGTHFDELRTRRWLVRTKSIWVVTLTPTRDTSVSRHDPDVSKIDSLYVAEQLGYMALPVGALSASRGPKPAMVLAVITKFDLFSNYDATHSASAQARETLGSVFADHVARVKQACAQRQVPFEVEFCSALEGWRTDALLRHVKRCLFA